MKIAVCQSAPEMMPGGDDWKKLATEVRKIGPDIMLLNEMPFGKWLAAAPVPDESDLQASRELHEEGINYFPDLGTRWVLGTQPIYEEGRSVNQAYVWNAETGPRPAHTKQFFPDEEGYYEARWFERGNTRFGLAETGDIKIGFLICTDVMFNEWARYYGRRGAHVIAVPRAVGRASLRRWKTAISMAAIVSGCYAVSSNRAGFDGNGQEFGAGAWIFDPLGNLIAETSPDNPVVAVELDLALVKRSQEEYPCYVKEYTSEKARI